MAWAATELELSGRDGTSQAGRRLPALDPGYVSVDERSIEDLLSAACDLAGRLRYFGEDDCPAGDWSGFLNPDMDLAEIAAFVEDPERFSAVEGRFRRPHMVLFLAFLGLFQHAQAELNQLTRRHLDLYFRRVLRMLRKPAVPDRVSLLFDLVTGVDQALVAAGSRLSAGPDSLGKEQLYATDRDLVVNRAQVDQLRSVHVGMRRAGLAEARERYRNDKETAVRAMLEIALGYPLPGDALPEYPGSPNLQGNDAGDLDFLRALRDYLETTRTDLSLEHFELRELMRLRDRRDGSYAEWTEINTYLEKAGQVRDPSFVLTPEDARDFDANLAAAIGCDLSELFGDDKQYKSIYDLYSQREDARTFISDSLFFRYSDEAYDDFVAMMQIRIGIDAEWVEINAYLEKAGKVSNPGFTLSPVGRSFDANLFAAIGPLDFRGLSQVNSIDDLYLQRHREDVIDFIDKNLPFSFNDFVAMMQIKTRIDTEWAVINRLLEAAGRKRNPDFSFPPELDPHAFADNLYRAVEQSEATLDQYTEEVRRAEAFFLISVDELIYFIGIADKAVAATTYDERRRVDRILCKAHRERCYTQRRQQLMAIHVQKGAATDDLPGFVAMINYILDESLTGAMEAAELLDPYLSRSSFDFLWSAAQAISNASAAGVRAVLDWQRIYSVLEIAWRNREQLPEPVPEKVERLSLYPAADATAIRAEPGVDHWRTFGMVVPGAEPLPALGWAVSSPLLALAEGSRTITLTFGLPQRAHAEQLLQDLVGTVPVPSPLRFELSTENGWIEPEIVSVSDTVGVYGALIGLAEEEQRYCYSAVQITLAVGEDVDAITPPPVEPDQPVSPWPVLRLMLLQLPDQDPYSALRQVRLAAVHIAVDVVELSSLQLQNDESVLDAAKPFEPFGTSPAVGSRLLFGHPELVTKRIDSLLFSLEWMGLPRNLAEYYRNYEFTNSQGTIVDPSFSVRISLVDHRVELLLMQEVPLFAADSDTIDIVIDPPQASSPEAPLDPLYDRDPQASLAEELQRSDRYLRWELDGHDFQHKVYPALAARKAIELAAAIANLGAAGNAGGDSKDQGGGATTGTINAAEYLVNPPYTPKLKSIRVGYTSSQEILLEDTLNADPQTRVLYVHPFGTSRVDPEILSQGAPLLPGYDNEGELYIGLRDLTPPQTVTLLLQLAEGSANPDLAAGQLSWSYLDGDSWQSLDEGKILSDTSRGLLNSGILELDLPAATASTLLPGDRYWLRAAVDRGAAAVCDTIAIHTQAVAATFVDRDNAADHFSQPLPAETLTRLVRPIPQIAGVRQPYTSHGGRGAEADDIFATRISERLRHKQRALAMWDYERLVLERFPEVYKVKCLPADRNDPGRVVVVVIPDVRNRFPFDPFEPKAPADLLVSIEEYLTTMSPAVAAIAVRNPHYVAVMVRVQVRFQGRGNEGYYKQLLNDELNRFLSPWAYEEGADITIGGSIYANSIVNFLDRRPYVDYVANLQLYSSEDGVSFVLVKPADDGGYAVSSERSDGVLVAARRHLIELIPEIGYREELAIGIGYMKIEFDFQVAPDPVGVQGVLS